MLFIMYLSQLVIMRLNPITGWKNILYNFIDRYDYIPDSYFLLGFSSLGMFMLIGQWGMISFGHTGQTQFFIDARGVWKPLGENVLRNGAPLYGINQWDNKPPVWQFLNLAVTASGFYYLVFYSLVGLAHGIGAYLLFVWVRSYENRRIGLVSALLFLGSVPAVFAARINPRPFAEVLILIAVITSTRSGVVSGATLAVATNLSQFSVLATPVVLWHGTRGESRDNQIRYILKFGGAALAVGVLAFAPVAIVWGTDALVYAIQYSVLSIGSYGSTSSVVVSPLYTISGHVAHFTRIYYLIFPAIVGILSFFRSDRQWTDILGQSILYSAVLLLPLFVRPGGIYLYPPLPFIAVLATIGLQDILASERNTFRILSS